MQDGTQLELPLDWLEAREDEKMLKEWECAFEAPLAELMLDWAAQARHQALLCPICGAEAVPEHCKWVCPMGHGLVENCNGD